MATRNVVLTAEQSALVDHLVTSGRYQNASEAMRAGCGCWNARKRSSASCAAALNAGWNRRATVTSPKVPGRMPSAAPSPGAIGPVTPKRGV